MAYLPGTQLRRRIPSKQVDVREEVDRRDVLRQQRGESPLAGSVSEHAAFEVAGNVIVDLLARLAALVTAPPGVRRYSADVLPEVFVGSTAFSPAMFSPMMTLHLVITAPGK